MTRQGERQLRTLAQQLRDKVETLGALSPAERCDLRAFPLEMLGLADEECAIRQACQRTGRAA